MSKRPDRVTVYRSRDKTRPHLDGGGYSPQYRWSLQDGGNFRVLAVSSEAYTKRAHCVRMARRLFPGAELVVEP